MSAPKIPALQWFCSGQEIFPAMLDAISSARKSIRLESYICSDGRLGRQFLDALLQAIRRGVRVFVMVDALGSWLLPDDFFKPLVDAGAEARRFNPLHLWRFGVRDHRKLLVCDDRVAFVGGFNLADEYDGDGVTRGWCDVGVRIEGPALVAGLSASFDNLFAMADFHRKPLLRLRAFKHRRKSHVITGGESFLEHPGREAGPFQTALRQDLSRARDVRIVTAYFLPTWRLRSDLIRVARRGGRVQLILPGKSDVVLSQLAGRNSYHRLLRSGVEIYEYQPQILHTKLIVLDDIIYVGSANLDVRSLKLNYELMLRFEDNNTAAGAREIFMRTLKHCRRIEPRAWRKSQTFWQRLEYRWAHFLLARVDPFVALRQFQAMKR
jgi:cardiolipin synthase